MRERGLCLCEFLRKRGRGVLWTFEIDRFLVRTREERDGEDSKCRGIGF